MIHAKAAALLAVLCVAHAHAQDAVVALGKQRAANSSLRWDVREAGHPVLGPIRFAFLKTPLSTAAGTARVSSNIYVSCERNTGKIAIELANGTRPDDPGGLPPRAMPRLTCSTLTPDGRAAAEDLDARWTVSAIGDVMARGFWPTTLRTCASIGVLEEVILPRGSSPSTARVEFEFSPYARELDAIFATCGEPTSYADASSSPPPPATSSEGNHDGWITARVVAEGRTNVRARASTASPLVIRLDPGDIVLVQRSDHEWWHARSRPGVRAAFEGFIRRDRLVVR